MPTPILPPNIFFTAGLLQSFMISNFMGKMIVIIQLVASVIALAVIIGKTRELNALIRNGKRFIHDFLAGRDVLDYYLSRKKGPEVTMERMYHSSCERMVKMFDPTFRNTMISSGTGTPGAALSAREVELIRGTCEHVVQEEEIRIESGLGLLACIVTASPMLGLLGTVWGVLDAFATMGEKGSVLLSEIAPSISSALLTTVVGLLVAIPSAIFYNVLAGKVRQISTDMVGFADELMGRIACEYQGRDA